MGLDTPKNDADSGDTGRGFAQFCVCGTWLAAAAESVETIGVAANAVHRLPLVPDYIAGQFSMNGEVFILFDMARFLEMDDDVEAASPKGTRRVVVLQERGMRVAIEVSETSRLVHLHADQIQHAGVLNNGRIGAFLSGEFESDLGRVGILDVARLMESARV